MSTDTLTFEVREAGGELVGVILAEGRAASGGRAELFAPGSLTWPADGIAIRTRHGGPVETRAFPHRDAQGRIHVRARATQAIRDAVEAGRRWMSVEFKAVEERTTKAGVRELLRAFVVGAALADRPEYDTTSAEVRSRRRRIWL